jgi:predicted phosphodiesterase
MEQGIFINPHEFRSREDILRRKETPYFDHAIDIFQQVQKLDREEKVGVQEAIWNVKLDDPNKPMRILMATDLHYGSINTDYDLLKKHLDIVENTPNTFIVTNGDHVDNFNTVGKWATGVYENPISPMLQMKSFISKIEQLDRKGKIGVMSFGNHDNFIDMTGYDWLESFASHLATPLFTSGGLLHIMVGNQRYDLALTHKYWGNSKLNPTNVCKRFMEHEYPDADIIFLGHTHQSEVLHFERGGKERVGIIGGTYKLNDVWARQNGIGGRAGQPGVGVMLSPTERRMTAYKHIEDSIHS